MSKQSLAIIAVCWVAALATVIWMFANDQQGALLTGLMCGVAATPFYVGLEMWMARKRG